MADAHSDARSGREARPNRPLSPHLQIYKPLVNMVMSIVHRMTGAALYLGSLLLAWWLIAAAVACPHDAVLGTDGAPGRQDFARSGCVFGHVGSHSLDRAQQYQARPVGARRKYCHSCVTVLEP